MQNRIKALLKEKTNLLSIYFTAGFPDLDSTVPIIQNLENYGANIIEIGIPYFRPAG